MIYLNFIPLKAQNFNFTIYRRKSNKIEKRDNKLYYYNLPESNTDKNNYFYYSISLSKLNGFESYDYKSEDNPYLFTAILFDVMKDNFKSNSNVFIKNVGISRFISFTINTYNEGKQVIQIYPYYLKSQNKYGYLVEFKFIKNANVPFTKRVQILSLSLANDYKSNINSYMDRYDMIQEFLQKYKLDFYNLKLFDYILDMEDDLIKISEKELKKKIYLFGKDQTGENKVLGTSGNPYKSIEKPIHIVFLFKNEDKAAANELFKALSGKSFSTFSGLNNYFNVGFNLNNVSSINIDFDNPNSQHKIDEEIKLLKVTHENHKIIGVLIDSYSKGNKNAKEYAFAKLCFYNNQIPLQVVTKELILRSDGLKWAVSNIALQIFAKVGGIPWLLKPEINDCLIFGIGIAHQINRDVKPCMIKKYYAYSVCLDSSGYYNSIGILAKSKNAQDYYNDLKKNIAETVKRHLQERPEIKHIILHTPFTLRNQEILEINQAITSIKDSYLDVDFSVVKINVKNRYDGFSDQNMRIPFQSTYIKLSEDEYLIWFDGLDKTKNRISKQVAMPAHVKFFMVGDTIKKEDILQDLVNFAGASWRGFNAKLEPISTFYPHLIASFVKQFREIDEEIENRMTYFDSPWFL